MLDLLKIATSPMFACVFSFAVFSNTVLDFEVFAKTIVLPYIFPEYGEAP